MGRKASTKGRRKMPIKIVIRKHMTALYGEEENWPPKIKLAKTLGMQTPTLRAWLEERVLRVDMDTLDKWCDHFDVDTGEILVREK